MKFSGMLLGLLLIGPLSWAQVSESKEGMSQGVKNALHIMLPNTTEKLVEDVWKDYMKEYKAKPKYDRKAKEHFSDDAEITSIGGSNTVDVYARIEERSGDVDFTLWFDLGGAYLNSDEHSAKYREAEEFLMEFALKVARTKTNEELEEEEKLLKGLESDLNRLERENERFHKEIEKAKERIAQAERDIETNLQEQEKMRKMVQEQTKKVTEVKKKLGDL